MHRFTKPSRHAGFTLMELLVAIAIALGLIVFISQILGTTTRAVTTGLDTSQVLQATRVASESFDSDALTMTGPGSEGVLIIVFDEVTTRITPNDIVDRDIRTDQLYFVRNRGQLFPICPWADNSFSGATSVNASHVRVFYGHGQKVKADGSDDGVLGATGINRFASQWVLCRQALFLDETIDLSKYGNYSDDSSAGSAPHHGARADGQILIQNGSKLFENHPSGNENSGDHSLYEGFTDVVRQSLSEYHSQINSAPGSNTELYTYINQRLRVNPQPVIGQYESWRAAQMHPLFIPNVSDFEIEFAGDYVDDDSDGLEDGEPDRDPGAPNPNQIRWYGPNDTPGVPGWTTHAHQVVTIGTATVYVFTSGNAELWPYLLRIRYRINDKHGNLMGSDGEPGRLVEQIIGVNRQ